MRAWRASEHGDPATVLQLDEITSPALRAHEVRIATEAVALNFADILVCRGTYQVRHPLPVVPGSECAGTVLEVGPEVTSVVIGERVMARPASGAFAEEVVTTEDSLHRVPTGMPATTAAAFHVTYQTAHLALHRRARLAAGDTLLVHAGAGGVGSAAIQLGRAAGARVLATAGGPEKTAWCRRLGAEVAIDYRTESFVDAVKTATGGAGVDVVFDPVGGDTFDGSTHVIAFEGRIVVVGFAGGRVAEARTNHMLVKNYDVLGVAWGAYATQRPEVVERIHAELMELHGRGLIEPLVSEVVAFEEIPAALARLADRATVGKVVATISG